MNETARKERYLGSEEEGIGWKIYGLVPFIIAAFAAYALYSAPGSRAAEDKFLAASTTERTTGRVVDITASYVHKRAGQLKLGKPQVSRKGGMIITKMRKSSNLVSFGESDRGEGDAISYTSIVEFEATDGKTYSFEGASGHNKVLHVPGDSVPVLYEQGNPLSARLLSQVHAGSTLGYIFGGLGLVIAGLMFYLNRKRITKKRKMFDEGIVVDAIINDVVVDKKITANEGEHPIRLVACWSDKDKKITREFTSDPIFKEYDPSLINEKVGVVMLADDPETYHVDTTFLEWRRAA